MHRCPLHPPTLPPKASGATLTRTHWCVFLLWFERQARDSFEDNCKKASPTVHLYTMAAPTYWCLQPACLTVRTPLPSAGATCKRCSGGGGGGQHGYADDSTPSFFPFFMRQYFGFSHFLVYEVVSVPRRALPNGHCKPLRIVCKLIGVMRNNVFLQACGRKSRPIWARRLSWTRSARWRYAHGTQV